MARRRKTAKPTGLTPEEEKISEFLLANVVPKISKTSVANLAESFKHIKEDDYFYVGELLHAMYLREDLRRFVRDYALECIGAREKIEAGVPEELIREVAKQYGLSYEEAYKLWLESHKEMEKERRSVAVASSRKLGQILKWIRGALRELGLGDSAVDRILILLSEAKDVEGLAEFYLALADVAESLSNISKSPKSAKSEGELAFVTTVLATRPDSFVRALRAAVEEFLKAQPSKKVAEAKKAKAGRVSKDIASIITKALSEIQSKAVETLVRGVRGGYNKEIADILLGLKDYKMLGEFSRALGLLSEREELRGTSPTARRLYHYEAESEEAFAYLAGIFSDINPDLPDFIIEHPQLAYACLLFANEIHKIARKSKKDASKIIEGVADVIRNNPNAFVNLASKVIGVPAPAEKAGKVAEEAVAPGEAKAPKLVLVGKKKVEYPKMLYTILMKLPTDLLVNLRNLSDEEKAKIFENLNVLIRTRSYEIVGRLVREILPKIAKGEPLTPEEEKIFEEYVLRKRAKREKKPEYVLTYDEAVRKIREIPPWMWDVLKAIGTPSHVLYFIRVCGQSPHLLSPEYLDEIIEVKKSAVVREELGKPPVEEFGRKVKWRTWIPFKTSTFIKEVLVARGERGAYPYEVYRAFKYVLWKSFPAERYHEFRREVAEAATTLRLRKPGEKGAPVVGIELDETLEGGPRVVDGALVSEILEVPPLTKEAESKMKHPLFHTPQFSSFWKYFKVLEEAGLVKKKTEKVGEVPLVESFGELSDVLNRAFGIIPKKIHYSPSEIYVEDKKSGNYYLLIPKRKYYEVHLARVASEEGHFGKPPFARQYYVVEPERLDSPVWSAPQKFVYPLTVFGKKRYSEILRKARELKMTPYEYLAEEIDSRLGELIRAEAGGALLWGNIEWFFDSLRAFKLEWYKTAGEGKVSEAVKKQRKEFISKYSEVLPILEIFILTAEDMASEIAKSLIRRKVMSGSPEEVVQRLLGEGPERLVLYTASTFVLLKPFRKGRYKEVWHNRSKYAREIAKVFAKLWKQFQRKG